MDLASWLCQLGAMGSAPGGVGNWPLRGHLVSPPTGFGRARFCRQGVRRGETKSVEHRDRPVGDQWASAARDEAPLQPLPRQLSRGPTLWEKVAVMLGFVVHTLSFSLDSSAGATPARAIRSASSVGGWIPWLERAGGPSKGDLASLGDVCNCSFGYRGFALSREFL